MTTEQAKALCEKIDTEMAQKRPKLSPEIVEAYRRLWKC